MLTIFEGIIIAFKWIWRKEKIIALLIVLLLISIPLSISIKDNKVSSSVYQFRDLEIVDVKQQQSEGEIGKLLITIKNRGSMPYNTLPYLNVKADGFSGDIYLRDEGYYAALREADIYFYTNNCIPPGEEVEIIYSYDSIDIEAAAEPVDAIISIETFSAGKNDKDDFKFTFVPN